MAEAKFIVFVVDDDESVRASLKLLIESSGYDVITFKSAEDFLGSGIGESPRCLILDIHLPGMSGLSHWLLDQVNMSLPDELVRVELAIDGMHASELESNEWAAAAERVKLMLILKKTVAREGIEVDESDIETRINAKAPEFGTTVEELRAQLEKGGGRERLRDLLVAERTLEYLLESVQK